MQQGIAALLRLPSWIIYRVDTEGVHTKIKLPKRLSCGFRNRQMYVRKMLLGLVPLALVLRPPHLLT
jgi:hypothetical protein